MKKTLLALSLLGVVGVASAQSNVQIYGTVDTGYIKETGSDLQMGENAINMIGFQGYEDLGGGLKATFQLEKQFSLYNGQRYEPYPGDRLKGTDDVEWIGAANLGLESDWGTVRFGRVQEISYEYFYPIDPFEMGTVGTTLAYFSLTHSEQLSDTVRYDSPEWNGLGFSASFTLSQDDNDLDSDEKDKTNYGFAGSIHYDNGPILFTTNYNRLADSDNSWVWNIGAGYQFGPARLSVGYETSKFKEQAQRYENEDWYDAMDQKVWLVGLTYEVGPGVIQLSYNRASVDNWKNGQDGDVNKYALGYTYYLSQRTSFYGVVAYTDSDNKEVGSVYNYNGQERESVTSFQIGMTHSF